MKKNYGKKLDETWNLTQSTERKTLKTETEK